MTADSILAQTYWCHFKKGHGQKKLGPFASREEALAAGIRENAKCVTTGYGNGGAYFDIRWNDRPYDGWPAKTK